MKPCRFHPTHFWSVLMLQYEQRRGTTGINAPAAGLPPYRGLHFLYFPIRSAAITIPPAHLCPGGEIGRRKGLEDIEHPGGKPLV